MKNKFLTPNFFRSAVAIAAVSLCSQAQAQWTTVGAAGFQPGGNFYQHIFFDAANTPYVSFSNGHGQVMKYDGTNWVSVGGPDITTAGANESWSAMGQDGNIYFSYSNSADSEKAEVLMYDGISWSPLGGAVSSGIASNTNIVQSSTGTVYISYLDKFTSPASLYVKKYTGGSWVTVGSAAIDTNGANFPSLALDGNDSLYIAYTDAANNLMVIVRKFNGTDWIMLDAPFSAQPGGDNSYISLAIDDANVPYVSYLNSFSGSRSACVSKYDGVHFITVGNAGFSPTGSAFAALAIDHSGFPYVVYADSALGALASVMKYDGTSWSILGVAGFSSSITVFNTIAIDANNNPYTAFLDGSNGGTTVMKFPVCTPPSATAITASDSFICAGASDILTATGNLHDAAKWYWHTGSCSGSLVDSGTSIIVAPLDTTTYYVSGQGGCVRSSDCVPFTINTEAVPVPTIAVAGMVLTSSTAAGYQWYLNNSAIPAATAPTYTATGTGWYKVVVTNSNSCSNTSDSVFVTVATGVTEVNNDIEAHVYPSPAADVLHIDLTGNQNGLANATLYILDNVGRQVFVKNELSQKNAFSIEGLPSGIYFVNITTSGNKQTTKIIKQ